MINKCDVQNRRVDTGFRLTKVGVTGVKKPVRINRDGDIALINDTLNCTIDVFVDLPAEQRGSHLSRNLEILRDIVDDSVKNPVPGIEALAVDICGKLLMRHEYADIAEVSMVADYFRNNRTPNGRETLEMYTLFGEASAVRGKGILKTIGVEVIGMTACPCAQETVGNVLGCKGNVAVMSHNQRNVCMVSMTTDERVNIEANDLIDIVEASFSSPTYEILKRDDEAAVVINAHNNPKFVEDVVRDVLKRIVEKYPKLPDDVYLTVRSESEESIHKHNALAERRTLLGDLRGNR
ncbi:MAG: GTP cyclohydrolase MptA [Methanomassiliicoccaceae archaeon]|jgi:GTP cyclohydrolase-4|nr:GTP cyclohydrolase MptA [Methanomassiliicoccaceae archaeon]